jgi:hypothetical protein
MMIRLSRSEPKTVDRTAGLQQPQPQSLFASLARTGDSSLPVAGTPMNISARFLPLPLPFGRLAVICIVACVQLTYSDAAEENPASGVPPKTACRVWWVPPDLMERAAGENQSATDDPFAPDAEDPGPPRAFFHLFRKAKRPMPA